MQKTIPTHLVSTYQLLQRAFPHGLDDDIYLPLLSILYEEMSDRSLAQVIAEYTGRDYYVVLNDVYYVGSNTAVVLPEIVNLVKQKLMDSGYEIWLNED